MGGWDTARDRPLTMITPLELSVKVCFIVYVWRVTATSFVTSVSSVARFLLGGVEMGISQDLVVTCGQACPSGSVVSRTSRKSHGAPEVVHRPTTP